MTTNTGTNYFPVVIFDLLMILLKSNGLKELIIETIEHMLNTKSEISTTPTAHVHSVDLDLYDSLLENVEVN